MEYFVYMLECAGGQVYTGITTDVARRAAEHVGRGPAAAKFTRTHPPVALRGVWGAPDRSQASVLEYRVKRLRRAEKLRLLEEPWRADAVAFPRYEGRLDGAEAAEAAEAAEVFRPVSHEQVEAWWREAVEAAGAGAEAPGDDAGATSDGASRGSRDADACAGEDGSCDGGADTAGEPAEPSGPVTYAHVRYDFGEVSPNVRKSMQGNKRRDTKPELAVRHMLRDLGFPGYRIDWKRAVGHPDIAYPGKRVAIFVMGCFWHRHEGCKYASTPSKNADYWQAKFDRNVERDARVREQLEAEGWRVIDVWECELKRDRVDATRERLRVELETAFAAARA